MQSQRRVLSGNRPTGKLHWGNYFGALKNWVDIQDDYECFYFIADWHSLTTGYEESGEIFPLMEEILKDWIACGLDPKKSTIFVQSWVPEHAELHLLLSMITPLGWLERVPSFKDMQQQLSDKDLSTYGFLGYPLLQAADILIYKAHFVPVGEDQIAHLEFARELVRRFHFIMKREVFIEPKPLLTESARVPGIDGRKMSKSFGNAIYISDDEDEIRKKMMQAITDPARKRRDDPGDPSVCNIFAYHKLFTDADAVGGVASKCRGAEIGCVDCKKMCIENAHKFWKPIRERRDSWSGREGELLNLAREGSARARKVACEVMQQVREAIKINYK
ncbi:MAG TPA: tryptophan--tRNA ligase [bacterium]|nr:tryptophan--tRNA ligase [Myxococcales bacterium]OQA60494.1 MAG: Tryptophan--tRNA ligase [bacterium ADurb.Bin270]HPW45948.1 tryptophan--tRNA ligase [bacterium]HQC50543.1 tryptophan--tRNA ligase [bacterium]HQH80473.1 tryptophan--tRNA ligase [bacterium]